MAMWRGDKEVEAGTPRADGLDPYRRLVELQKQMILLAQQNERVRQTCEELRARVTARVAPRNGLRQKAANALKKLPGIGAAKPALASNIVKQPSTC